MKAFPGAFDPFGRNTYAADVHRTGTRMSSDDLHMQEDCGPLFRGAGRDEANGSFAGKVEGAGYRLQKAAVIGSVKAVWKTL